MAYESQEMDKERVEEIFTMGKKVVGPFFRKGENRVTADDP